MAGLFNVVLLGFVSWYIFEVVIYFFPCCVCGFRDPSKLPHVALRTDEVECNNTVQGRYLLSDSRGIKF